MTLAEWLSGFWHAAYLTGLIAVLLWLATRVVEIRKGRRDRLERREQFIRALFFEIDYNTRDMEIFARKSPEMSVVEAKMRSDRAFIPHITDARHTEIYTTNIASLHFLDRVILGDVVEFYGELAKLKSQIDGLDKPSFVTISDDGRIAAISRIGGVAGRCGLLGRKIIADMNSTYPQLSLMRSKRSNGADDGAEAANEALLRLASEKDRVGSAHDDLRSRS